MRTAGWVLLALLAPQDRAESFFDRVTFEEAKPEGEPGERVAAALKSRDHWLSALRAIESRLGPMRENLAVKVSFDYEGEEAAKAASRGQTGVIRFNLKKLEDQQKLVDRLDRQKEELAREGKRLVFRVPPARLDRILWHELTHIFHGDLDAPEWFTEGLAQWMSEDMNCIRAFAVSDREVTTVEAEPEEKVDVYARGHLFWSWVAARGGVKRVAQAVVQQQQPWKAALEKALGLAWDSITAAEREWSTKEVAKLRRR